MRRRRAPSLLLLTLLTLGVVVAQEAGWLERLPGLLTGRAAPEAGAGEARVLAAFEAGESGVVVELEGTVEKVLSDDRRGSRHQRFILGLSSGHTLLVSHNIDLSPRVEGLRQGDRVALRGQYEWNERGGVVHWTHHDPGGRRPGGWIRHEGQLYR